jgi:hypothetical protein
VHQPIRALLATLAAAAALTIAVATTSSAATPSATPQPTPSTPGAGAACALDRSDCTDIGIVGRGDSEPGSPGSGVTIAPPTTHPAPSCGPTTDGTASGPNATVATLPCLSGQERRPQPLVVVPRPGMADLRPIAFASAAVRSDDRTVDLRFWSGIAPCSVLDHVDVEYDIDAVTITLFDGSDPHAGMVACPDIAMLKQVTVPLDQALGGRRIVDGA